MLYVCQYGGLYYARTIKELREQIGGGQVRKMYNEDRKDRRKSFHSGYVVGRLWLRAFVPYRGDMAQ